MKRRTALFLALLTLLTLAGCQQKPAAGTADFLGNAVTMPKYAERIVSLTPTNTEIVCALGLQSKLVGVDTYSDYPESVKDIAKVGTFTEPNAEQIVALKPDLVLGGNKLQKDAIDKLKALGLNVVAAEATDYQDVAKSIELVGELTGTQKQAEAVIADMKAKEKIVTDAVKKAAAGKSVYYAMSFGEMGNWTGGPGSFPYELIQMCGGKNLTDGLGAAWINLSQEDLVAKDPDIILLDSSMGSDPSAFCAAQGYTGLKAVENNQVYVVTSNFCDRPGPRIVYGLREFAQFITGTTIKFPGE